MNPTKRWSEIAKLLPSTTPEQCSARWDHIKSLPGLEYKAIALATPRDRRAPRNRADSSEDGRSSRESSADPGDGRQQSGGANDAVTADTAGAENKKEMVVLHVLDEHRKINRDFVCHKDILLREMKYFRNYLVDGMNSEDIDISVHCDVKIFEWLIKYLHQPEQTPHLGM